MTGMDLPITGPHPPHRTKFVNVEGLSLRLQVFVIPRDGQGRICCVREKADNMVWKLAGETLQPEESVDECARRVSELWFGTDLGAQVSKVVTWPDTGDLKKYIVFVYEARVPDEGAFQMPDDTDAYAFVEPGKAPGPWGMAHGDLFAELS